MDASLKKSKMPHIEVIDINTGSKEEKPSLHFEVNDAFLDMIKEERGIDKENPRSITKDRSEKRTFTDFKASNYSSTPKV